MASRTALLIGVGETPDAAHRFDSLETPVAADLRALGASLRAAGYEVRTVPGASRAEIITTVDEVSRGVPDDGTLLIHFTGHGIRVGGTDHLVPADARAPRGEGDGNGDGDGAEWTQPYLDTLLPADISPYLTHCRAGTVLWLIDACRGEPADGVFGSSVLKGPPSGRFALLTACAAGQRAGYSAGGSFFTLGLAEAFRPLTQARTVQEVFETARQHTLRTARLHGAADQEPQVRYGTEREAQARAAVVCEGRRLLEAWRDAVAGTALWERVAEDDAAGVPQLRECLGELVETCAQVVHLAQERMPDPWADDDFLVRVVRDQLPRLVPKTQTLSALEAAALVAAPLLHEVAWARRLSHASDISPYTAWHRKDGDAWRRHYEQVAEHHPHIKKKLSDCLIGARPEEARDIALWLVHRWIAERFVTDETAVPEVESRALADALCPGPRARELSAALSQLAAGIVLGPPAPDRGRRQDLAFPVLGGARQPLRSDDLAGVLHLACLLALDVRVLPEVLAEHLAVRDPVLPQDAVNAVRDADWHTADGDLHLDAACPHPALHAAFAGVVEQADELTDALRDTARGLPAPRAALLSGLPARVTDRGLRPAEDRGHRAYDVPLLRFQLSQTEVRDLLMGERIYDGEPDLALRELYQNAMDACRHRALRHRYLRSRGAHPAPWSGRIVFTEGEDERGRYIECRDNGVGMGLDRLKNTFTKAGRRFEQSRAFRQEQATWHRHDPALRLYPNSRFGIGVFSYFMLAEEMTVVTRPVGTDGIPARRALRVDIPGSANLFRVQEYDDAFAAEGDGLLEGGTRVRLYLRDSAGVSRVSPVATLERLVMVSEFALRVRDASGRQRNWEPGVLRYASADDGTTEYVEAVPGVLWWVSGQGAILCDGIGTDKKPFGYVLDLTGPQAGTLSLNRKKLQSYDREWEARQWARGAGALAEWPDLDMAWLWRLERHNLAAARTVWEQWRGRGVRVRDHDLWGGQALDLDSAGWFHWDVRVVRGRSRYGVERDWPEVAAPWRAAVLGGGRLSQQAMPVSTAGHPVPEPGWARVAQGAPPDWGTRISAGREPLDWRVVVALADGTGMTVREVVRAARGLRIVHPVLKPPRVLCRPAAAGEGRDGLDWTPDPCDAQIIEGLLARGTRNGWQRAGRRKNENDYEHAPDDLGGLVRTSRAAREPLGRLAERCARFAPFLSSPPPVAPDHHVDHVCDATDLALLYREGPRGWRRVRWPWDVIEIADTQQLSPLEVRERLARFAWLGWTAPDADAVRRWAGVPWDISVVLQAYCVPDPDGRLTLPWAATFALAAEWEVPLRKAEKMLARWADHLGLAHTRRYREKSAAGRLVPVPETASVLGRAHTGGLTLEDGLSLRDLAFVRPQSTSWDDLAVVLEDLREAGADVPAAGGLLRAWEELPVPSRYAFSGSDPSLDAADYPVLPTADILFASSIDLRTPLATTWKTARREAKRVRLEVPDLPTELAGFRPGREEGQALLDWGEEHYEEWAEPPRWAALTAERLVTYARSRHIGARAAYERLSPLRELGAQIPELDPADIANLPAGVPDARDAVALGAAHRVSAPGSPLRPLDLLSLAGRLGEPVTVTWRRIVPYLPLEASPPALDPAAVPEELPRWQDLIVLSVHADGALPALSGRLTPEQIRFAADAVDESEEWVAERLGRYAALFGLELPTLPSGLPAEEPDAAN
ncbi:HD domain-containing protein [Streptomyces aureocirculatus]|uniref:HD domain-containing protein n=1 Tax=Streptomyces aureocirculatus TaxID=67275 RepID=UPI00068E827B|nr:caspase family protein [Streptomyces aureocirculatus]